MTRLAGLRGARKQIPTRQERLHPADSLRVQAQILDHVLDVLDSPNVLKRKEAVSRDGTEGDDETFVLVLADCGNGQAHHLGQDANGDDRLADFVVSYFVRHEFACNRVCYT